MEETRDWARSDTSFWNSELLRRRIIFSILLLNFDTLLDLALKKWNIRRLH